MIFYESDSHDPYWNLAMEEYVFHSLPRDEDYFLLWQNDNAVIVGKFQNSVAEINSEYVEEHGIRVARRLSGGGAVYHDLGNVNYTFITDAGNTEELNLHAFCEPLKAALQRLGVPAEISGRNDVLINGLKCSGSSQYLRRGRVMHHGCIMFNTDVSVLSHALNYRPEKYVSKGTESVRSRVTNIADHMDGSVSVREFMDLLKTYMVEGRQLETRTLTAEDRAAIQKLRDEKYSTWEWNFGSSPKYDAAVSGYIEGCGFIELSYNVSKGRITDFRSQGDYFGSGDPDELRDRLIGCEIRRESLAEALKDISIPTFFSGLTLEQFLDLLLK
ncbi:MAG: lipoate--protein ligase [Lentisphaeria bacterium]|nr:lipoate--protein ligase [Lentisphaeria bacterium]